MIYFFAIQRRASSLKTHLHPSPHALRHLNKTRTSRRSRRRRRRRRVTTLRPRQRSHLSAPPSKARGGRGEVERKEPRGKHGANPGGQKEAAETAEDGELAVVVVPAEKGHEADVAPHRADQGAAQRQGSPPHWSFVGEGGGVSTKRGGGGGGG